MTKRIDILRRECEEIAERKSSGEIFNARQNVMKLMYNLFLSKEEGDELLNILNNESKE